MATVCLYGALAEYGRRFDLAVDSAAEAVRALCVQIEGFRAALSQGGYFVRAGGRNIGAVEELGRAIGADSVIHIVPEAAGGGKFGQIIAGVVMIVASIYTGGLAGAAWASASQGLMAAGIGMVVGGVAQLLVKAPDMNFSQSDDKSRSSAFTNLDNISPQGAHVPVAYGYLTIGSVVVSQSIESYDVKDEAEKPVGDVAYRRVYHTPEGVAATDETRAVNYILQRV